MLNYKEKKCSRHRSTLDIYSSYANDSPIEVNFWRRILRMWYGSLYVFTSFHFFREWNECTQSMVIVTNIIPRLLNNIFCFIYILSCRGHLAGGQFAPRQEWQRRWDEADVGRWTHSVVPIIQTWLDRGHGDCSYFTTQFLTGHGSFGKYLHRIGKAASPSCHYCGAAVEDAGHTSAHCAEWEEKREELRRTVGGPLGNPEEFVSTMLSSPDSWTEIDAFITEILKKKAQDE